MNRDATFVMSPKKNCGQPDALPLTRVPESTDVRLETPSALVLKCDLANEGETPTVHKHQKLHHVHEEKQTVTVAKRLFEECLFAEITDHILKYLSAFDKVFLLHHLRAEKNQDGTLQKSLQPWIAPSIDVGHPYLTSTEGEKAMVGYTVVSNDGYVIRKHFFHEGGSRPHSEEDKQFIFEGDYCKYAVYFEPLAQVDHYQNIVPGNLLRVLQFSADGHLETDYQLRNSGNIMYFAYSKSSVTVRHIFPSSRHIKLPQYFGVERLRGCDTLPSTVEALTNFRTGFRFCLQTRLFERRKVGRPPLWYPMSSQTSFEVMGERDFISSLPRELLMDDRDWAIEKMRMMSAKYKNREKDERLFLDGVWTWRGDVQKVALPRYNDERFVHDSDDDRFGNESFDELFTEIFDDEKLHDNDADFQP